MSPVQRITHDHINKLIHGLYQERDLDVNPEDIVDDTILKSRFVPCVGIMDSDTETVILRKFDDVQFAAHYPDDYRCIKLSLPSRSHYFIIKEKKHLPSSAFIGNKGGLIVFKDVKKHPYFGVDFKINHIGEKEIGVTGIKDFRTLLYEDHEKILAPSQKIFKADTIDYIQFFVGTDIIYE